MASFERILKLSKLSAAEKKGATDFLKGLTPNRVQLIETIARETANFEIKDFTNNMSEALDRSICASLVLNLDLPYSDIVNSLSNAYELMEQDNEIIKKIKNGCGGDLKMAKKKLAEYEGPVRDKCLELLRNDITNQKKALAILETQFPLLSKAMLTNAFSKVKEEFLSSRKLEEVAFENVEEKEAAEKIVDIICNGSAEEVNAILKEEDKKAEVKVKEEAIVINKEGLVVNGDVVETSKVHDVKEAKLKVKYMEVEGENGTYKVSPEGLELSQFGDKISFQNEDQLNEWTREVQAVFSLRAATK